MQRFVGLRRLLRIRCAIQPACAYRESVPCLQSCQTLRSKPSVARETALSSPGSSPCRCFAATNRLPDEATAAALVEEDSDDADSALEEEAPPVASFYHYDLGEGLTATAEPAAGSAAEPTHFEVGRLARLAQGACSVTRGATQVLAAITCNHRQGFRRDEGLMLQVEYRERLYASGRMPKSITHSEGPPTVEETLACCSTETALRPLFPPAFPFDLQVAANVMSVDKAHDPVVAAINAASAALTVSPIPWAGPVGAVRVAVAADGGVHVDPPLQGQPSKPLRLQALVVGTRSGIVVLQAQGEEASPEDFAAALAAAQPAVASLITAQEQLASQAQVVKETLTDASADPAALATIAKHAQQAVLDAVRSTDGGKIGRERRLDTVQSQLTDKLQKIGAWRFGHSRLKGSGCVSSFDLDTGMQAMVNGAVRGMALNSNIRTDGRGLTDLQPVHCKIACQTVVHGSTVYQGGETQAAASVTVAPTDARDMPTGSGKALFVHFSLPAFAASEVSRRLGGLATRREVMNAEAVRTALLPSIPPPSPDFPWTVRVNADTLASNGPSSMAAVCAASLALRAAGLPIRHLTAGVSIGLVARPEALSNSFTPVDASGTSAAAMAWQSSDDGSRHLSTLAVGHELLVDIQGVEQQAGEMVLDVAATRRGITAARLEVTRRGVSIGTIIEALRLARQAHMPILAALEQAATSAASTSPQRLGTVTIDTAKIGRLIGTNGSTIKAVQEETCALFSVHDSGRVAVYAPLGNLHQAKEAAQAAIGGNIKAGQQYTAQVVRIMDYGAFVELSDTGGTQALLHISELAVNRVRSVEDVVSIGQKLQVLCTGRDARGNAKISAKALLQGSDDDALR